MDPRYTSIVLTPVGIALVCDQCHHTIHAQEVTRQDQVSLFEVVRSALRHSCQN